MSEAFELPLGVIQGGSAHKEIILNPMTAGIRRGLLSKSNQKNPTAGLTDLFGQCCESIGGNPPNAQLLNGLTTGDRDFIMLCLRKISVGPVVHGQVNCPRCQVDINFDLNVDDIHVNRVTEGEDYEIEGSWAIRHAKSEELATEVSFRLPTGYDQMAVTDKMRQDPLLANYELYARIIKSWSNNGTLVEIPNSLKFIDSLPLAHMEWLEEEFRKAMPGPDWMVNLTCEVCGRRSLLDLSDTDFLFKTRR